MGYRLAAGGIHAGGVFHQVVGTVAVGIDKIAGDGRLLVLVPKLQALPGLLLWSDAGAPRHCRCRRCVADAPPLVVFVNSAFCGLPARCRSPRLRWYC